MKKFISAVMALAMTVGMMSSMSVAHAEEVTPTVISTATELVNALKNGGNYKLADEITSLSCTGVNLKIQSDVVIDLNEAEVITKGDGFFVTDASEVNFELKNGKIMSTATGTGNFALQIKGTTASQFKVVDVEAVAKQPILIQGAAHEVVIEDSKLSGGTSNGGVISISYGKCDVSNTEITYSTASGIKLDSTNPTEVIANNVTIKPTETATAGNAITGNNGANATLTINGGSYAGIGNNNYAIFWKATGNVTITDADINYTGTHGVILFEDGTQVATITLNNANISNLSSSTYPSLSIIKGKEANINGGNYVGVLSKGSAFVAENINITGGTFSFNPTSYVDTEAYTVTEADGTYTVTEKTVEPEPTPEISAVTAIDDTVIEGSDGFGKLFTFAFKYANALTADKISVSYDGAVASSLSNTTIAANSEVVFGVLVSSTDKAKIDGIDTAKFSVSVD